MSFWTLSTGETAPQTTESGFDNSIIPKGTKAPFVIEEIKWDEYQGEKNINLRVKCMDGQYKNRGFFHTFWVNSQNPQQRDIHIKMLMAINVLMGSKLPADREPTDMELMQYLTNKPFMITVGEYKGRNQIGFVGSANQTKTTGSTQSNAAQQSNEPSVNFDDDVPF